MTSSDAPRDRPRTDLFGDAPSHLQPVVSAVEERVANGTMTVAVDTAGKDGAAVVTVTVEHRPTGRTYARSAVMGEGHGDSPEMVALWLFSGDWRFMVEPAMKREQRIEQILEWADGEPVRALLSVAACPRYATISSANGEDERVEVADTIDDALAALTADANGTECWAPVAIVDLDTGERIPVRLRAELA